MANKVCVLLSCIQARQRRWKSVSRWRLRWERRQWVKSIKRWGFFNWHFFLLFFGFAIYMGVGMYNNYNNYEQAVGSRSAQGLLRESPYIARDAATQCLGNGNQAIVVEVATVAQADGVPTTHLECSSFTEGMGLVTLASSNFRIDTNHPCLMFGFRLEHHRP